MQREKSEAVEWSELEVVCPGRWAGNRWAADGTDHASCVSEGLDGKGRDHHHSCTPLRYLS